MAFRVPSAAHPTPRRGLRRTLAALVGVVLVLAGCSEPETVEPTPTSEAPVHVARAPGFDSEVVSLAVLADLSGPDRVVQRRWLAGVELAWAELNAAGGLGGKFPVELIVRDHGGDPEAALVHYRELSDSIAGVAMVGGDAAVEAVVPEAADDGVLVVPGRRVESDWDRRTALPAGSTRAVAQLAVMQHLGEGPIWCGVVDGSARGRAAARALPAAAAELSLEPPVVLQVDADRPLSDALAVANDEGCRVWLAVEVGAADTYVAGAVPEAVIGLDVELGAQLELPAAGDHPRVLFGVDAPEWSDAAPGMADLIDVAAVHAPDVDGDLLVTMGYSSQLRLRRVLEEAVGRSDLRRAAIEVVAGDLPNADEGGLVSIAHPWRDGLPNTVRVFELDPDGGDPTGWSFVDAVVVADPSGFGDRLG